MRPIADAGPAAAEDAAGGEAGRRGTEIEQRRPRAVARALVAVRVTEGGAAKGGGVRGHGRGGREGGRVGVLVQGGGVLDVLGADDVVAVEGGDPFVVGVAAARGPGGLGGGGGGGGGGAAGVRFRGEVGACGAAWFGAG